MIIRSVDNNEQFSALKHGWCVVVGRGGGEGGYGLIKKSQFTRYPPHYFLSRVHAKKTRHSGGSIPHARCRCCTKRVGWGGCGGGCRCHRARGSYKITATKREEHGRGGCRIGSLSYFFHHHGNDDDDVLR